MLRTQGSKVCTLCDKFRQRVSAGFVVLVTPNVIAPNLPNP